MGHTKKIFKKRQKEGMNERGKERKKKLPIRSH